MTDTYTAPFIPGMFKPMPGILPWLLAGLLEWCKGLPTSTEPGERREGSMPFVAALKSVRALGYLICLTCICTRERVCGLIKRPTMPWEAEMEGTLRVVGSGSNTAVCQELCPVAPQLSGVLQRSRQLSKERWVAPAVPLLCSCWVNISMTRLCIMRMNYFLWNVVPSTYVCLTEHGNTINNQAKERDVAWSQCMMELRLTPLFSNNTSGIFTYLCCPRGPLLYFSFKFLINVCPNCSQELGGKIFPAQFSALSPVTIISDFLTQLLTNSSSVRCDMITL